MVKGQNAINAGGGYRKGFTFRPSTSEGILNADVP
jgi:hypothetical protein